MARCFPLSRVGLHRMILRNSVLASPLLTKDLGKVRFSMLSAWRESPRVDLCSLDRNCHSNTSKQKHAWPLSFCLLVFLHVKARFHSVETASK
jgi:hypothetical protein